MFLRHCEVVISPKRGTCSFTSVRSLLTDEAFSLSVSNVSLCQSLLSSALFCDDVRDENRVQSTPGVLQSHVTISQILHRQDDIFDGCENQWNLTLPASRLLRINEKQMGSMCFSPVVEYTARLRDSKVGLHCECRYSKMCR